MSKRFNSITGTEFTRMVLSGAEILRKNVNNVNALNVFPVPDGDTGTNMNLTMTSGVEEIRKKPSEHIGRAADALSKGLLMGARGNSGVILSQLFRGFAKSVQNLDTVNPLQFAAALQQGVETAYKAVVKPVEGTILTVAKEAAKHAQQYARRTNDVADLMQEVYQQAQQALNRTPDMLPVLKQVGVVDSGGQGLVFVYEGFLRALTGAESDISVPVAPPAFSAARVEAIHHDGHEGKTAQSMLATEDIEQGYCTEFIIKLVTGKTPGYRFEEQAFRNDLSKMGDSLLVVADDDLVKIHIHAEYPGTVMNHAMKYGDLTRIKIENMREQHTHILETSEYDLQYAAAGSPQDTISQEITVEFPVTAGDTLPNSDFGQATRSAYGLVAVAMGDGISDIFQSLGVNFVISGGQTMNPSTEDIVNAVNSVNAETVYVFPNNSNIVMAARQAQHLVEDKTVIVIPTKTIPQGMAALIAFQESADADSNTETMNRAIGQIVSGQVTNAVRDTSIEGVDIKEGDYIGICEGKIVVSRPDLLAACQGLLDQMLSDGGEIVTMLSGEDAREEQTAALVAYLEAQYPQVDVEIHEGGQPVYVYLFAVE